MSGRRPAEHRERLLRRLEDEQRRARIGTFEFDLKTRIPHWSAMMYELHDVPLDYPVPSNLDEYAPLVHPDDVGIIDAAAERALQVDQAFECEIRARRGAGWVHLRVIFHCERSPAGESLFLSGSMQDITGDADVRRDLIRDRETARDEARAKTRFLARVTHELRTPLAGVIGMIDLALGDQDAAIRGDHLNSARASARHLLELIDDLLDASREDTWRINVVEIEFDLRQVLQQALDMVAPRAQRKVLSLESTFEAGLSPIRLGDPLRLRQILVNLLYNAVKFTPSGRVTARIAAGETPDAVVLVVEDTGVGIPPEMQGAMFEPFVQGAVRERGASGEGVGLGLAITRELVAAMGGTIELCSTVGVGSRFTVALKLLPGRGESTNDRLRSLDAGSSPSMRPAPTGMRVLVAEDHPTNAAIAQAVLERAGHRCHWVPDGAAAVAAVAAERFDAVLMDLEMPVVDGAEAARRIRAAEHEAGSARLPIIALSAHKEAELAAASAGMDAYLRKPLDAGTLDAVLSRVAAGELRGPIDHDERLGKVGRRAELARTVATTFLNHAPTLLEPVDDAIAARDTGDLRRAAHGLRAALLMVGAVRAAELTASIERASMGEAARLRDLLAAELARATAALTLVARR